MSDAPEGPKKSAGTLNGAAPQDGESRAESADREKDNASEKDAAQQGDKEPRTADNSLHTIDQELLAQKRRTIATEFGTVVIDEDGIRVVAAEDSTIQPLDSVSDKSSVVQRHQASERVVGSRMFMLNATSTASRMLETLAERRFREDRGVWSSDLELMLVTVSALSSVHMVFTMPRVWLMHGAVSFQLAYLLFCGLVALPLLQMEAALGQYAAHGLAGLMPQMAPALRGYSYALLVSLCVTVICNVPEIATVAVYGTDAMRLVQPWTSCDGEHNTFWCYNIQLDHSCNTDITGDIYFNGTCMDQRDVCAMNFTRESTSDQSLQTFKEGSCKLLNETNSTFFVKLAHRFRMTAGEEYFYNIPTQPFVITGGVFSSPNLAAQTACWFLLGILSHFDLGAIRSSLPVLLGLPMVILLALAIKLIVSGSKLMGMVWKHLIPDVSTLADPSMWFYAALLSLQSLNIGTGINSIVYSRNLITHDCKKSAVKVTLAVMMLTFCMGTSYMLVLGQQAASLGLDMQQLMEDTTGRHPLVTAAAAMSTLSHTRVWTTLLMLAAVLLGLGTCQVFLIAVETSLRELDILKSMSSRRRMLLICALGFFADMMFILNGGHMLLTVTNHYAVCRYSVILSFTMVIAAEAILGTDRLLDSMTKFMAVPMDGVMRKFWLVTWRYVCTIVLSMLIIGSVVFHEFDPLHYKGSSITKADSATGIVLLLTPTLVMIATVFYINHKNEKGVDMFAPTSLWRPGLMSPDNMARSLMNLGRRGGVNSSHILMQPAPSIMTRLYSKLSSAWKIPLKSNMSFEINEAGKAVPPEKSGDEDREGRKEERRRSRSKGAEPAVRKSTVMILSTISKTSSQSADAEAVTSKSETTISNSNSKTNITKLPDI